MRTMAVAHWNLALWRALLCAAALAACSGDVDGSGGAGPSPTSTTTSGGGSGDSGGGGGAGGSGGGEAPLDCLPGSYSNVPVDECDLLQQNCGPGQTCAPYATFSGNWTTRCVEGTGLKGAGKSCVVQGECAAGLFCIGGNAGSICSPICCPASDEPCGGGQCQAEVAYGPYAVRMCTYDPQCQLFDPNACSSGGECHIADAGQGLATCTPPAPEQSDEGGPCTFINSCKTMQECANNICRYYCRTDAPGDLPPGEGGCPAGQACQPASFGIPGVGLCQPM